MNSKEKSDKIKYFLSENNFDKARELAKDYKLKETEIKIIGKANHYLAGQKAKKYGLYKKAIDFYSKLYKEDTQDEIKIIYEIISKDINNKKFLKIFKRNLSEKDEKDLSGLVKYSNLLDLDQYAPMVDLINPN